MKKRIILIKILIMLTFNIQSQGRILNSQILNEDDNLKLTILWESDADLGNSDWLKLEITNKSNSQIEIENATFAIGKREKLKNGDTRINYGHYGQGNDADLLQHYRYEFPKTTKGKQNDIIIKPDSSIYSWKYITNYASVLLESRSDTESNICAFFDLKIRYRIDDEIFKIESNKDDFCFNWTELKNIAIEKLISRLREIILNPTYRWVNTYVTNRLMKNKEIVKAISTDDLVKGVVQREDVMNSNESIMFLSELQKRNAIPDLRITNSYSNRLKANDGSVLEELEIYWDNQLLEILLNSGLGNIHNILELNSSHWSGIDDNNKKVYLFLLNRFKFSTQVDIDLNNPQKWIKSVKAIAISRDPEFIKYLKMHLDNETEFSFEYTHHYLDPETYEEKKKTAVLTTRICDIAFIALLRTYNQFEFKFNINKHGQGYTSIEIKDEILDKKTIDQLKNSVYENRMDLNLFENGLKLTPELKKKILEK